MPPLTSLGLSFLMVKSKVLAVPTRQGYKHSVTHCVNRVRLVLLAWPGPSPSLDLSLPVWATRVKTQEYTCCLMAHRTGLVFQSCSRTRVVSLDLPSLSLGFPECTGAGRT